MLDIGSGRVTPFLNSQFNEINPEYSPVGGWLAYTSNESRREEVYVVVYPGRSKKVQISIDGGNSPLWARDGKQLFYQREAQVWVVGVQAGGSFAAGKPHMLFDLTGYFRSNPVRGHDLSKDGKRFLMVKADQRKPTPVTEMTLVVNWFEQLKRLVLTR